MEQHLNSAAQEEVDLLYATYSDPSTECVLVNGDEIRELAGVSGSLWLRCRLQPRDVITSSGLLARTVSCVLMLGIGDASYPEKALKVAAGGYMVGVERPYVDEVVAAAEQAAAENVGGPSGWAVLSAATAKLEMLVKYPPCACCYDFVDASQGALDAEAILANETGSRSATASKCSSIARSNASIVLPCMHVSHARCWYAWAVAHRELWRTGKAGRTAMEAVKARFVAQRGAAADLANAVEQARKSLAAKDMATKRASGLVSGIEGQISKVRADSEGLKGKHLQAAEAELSVLQGRLRKAKLGLEGAYRSQKGAHDELARYEERQAAAGGGGGVETTGVDAGGGAASGAGRDAGIGQGSGVGEASEDYKASDAALEETAWAEAVRSVCTPCPVCRREVPSETGCADSMVANLWRVSRACAGAESNEKLEGSSSGGSTAVTNAFAGGDKRSAKTRKRGTAGKARGRRERAAPAGGESASDMGESKSVDTGEASADVSVESGAATSSAADRRYARRYRRQKRRGKAAAGGGGGTGSGAGSASAPSSAPQEPTYTGPLHESDGEEDMETLLAAWAAQRDKLNASLTRYRRCHGTVDDEG